MKQVISGCKNELLVFMACLVFGLLFLPFFRYGINPDGISYIGIAEKYSNADFRHAINGYWGPLLSWLITPAFWLKIDPLVWARLLGIVFAGLSSVLVYRIIRVSANPKVALFGSLFSGFVLVSTALYGPITPDILFVFILLCLVVIGTKLMSKQSQATNILFGVFGAMLYFAKPIGFYLFVLLWSAVLVYLARQKKKFKPTLKKIWISLAVFLAITLPFIALLAIKYERLVISTSSSYNLSLIGPQSSGHPLANSIVAPPNPTAVSAGEDISNAPVVEWSPFSSIDDLEFLIDNMAKNAGILADIMWKFSFPLIILAVYGFYIISKNNKQKEEKFLIATVSFLLILLYLPLFYEPRYLIFIQIATIIGFCWFVGLFLKINRYHAVLWLVAGSAVFIAVFWQVNSLYNKIDSGKIVRSDALSLKQALPPGSKIAGDSLDSLFACYYTGSQCYGVVVPSNKTNYDLAVNNIKYLLITDSTAKQLSSLGVKLEKIETVSYLNKKLFRVIDT